MRKITAKIALKIARLKSPLAHLGFWLWMYKFCKAKGKKNHQNKTGVFPRLAPVTCFPELGARCMFFRAWHLFHCFRRLVLFVVCMFLLRVLIGSLSANSGSAIEWKSKENFREKYGISFILRELVLTEFGENRQITFLSSIATRAPFLQPEVDCCVISVEVENLRTKLVCFLSGYLNRKTLFHSTTVFFGISDWVF